MLRLLLAALAGWPQPAQGSRPHEAAQHARQARLLPLLCAALEAPLPDLRSLDAASLESASGETLLLLQCALARAPESAGHDHPLTVVLAHHHFARALLRHHSQPASLCLGGRGALSGAFAPPGAACGNGSTAALSRDVLALVAASHDAAAHDRDGGLGWWPSLSACRAWGRVAGETHAQPGALVFQLSAGDAWALAEAACLRALRLLHPQPRSAPPHPHAGAVSLALADSYRAQGRVRAACLRYIAALSCFDAAGGAVRLGWDAYVAALHAMSMLVSRAHAAPQAVLAYLSRSASFRARARLLLGVAGFRATLLPSAGVWTADHDEYHVGLRGALLVTMQLHDALLQRSDPPTHAEQQLLLHATGTRSVAATEAAELVNVLVTGLHELSRIEAAFHDVPAWLPLWARTTRLQLRAAAERAPELRVPPSLRLVYRHMLVQRPSQGASLLLHRVRTARVGSAATPLRLAYVSGDFRRHVIGYMMHGVLASHSRPPARAAVTVACYHTAGFDAPPPLPDSGSDLGELAVAGPHAVADGTCWGPHRDLSAWWRQSGHGHPAPLRARGYSTGERCAALDPAQIDRQLGDARYALHTPRLIEACDSFYAPLLWHGGAAWQAPEVAAHIAGRLLHAPNAGSGAHIAIDVSGPTQAGAADVLVLGAAPIQVHYMSGPMSVLDARHAQYMVMDPVVMPPDLAFTTLDACLPRAMGIARVGRVQLHDGAAACNDASADAAPRRVTLPTFAEAPVYVAASFLAATYPQCPDDQVGPSLPPPALGCPPLLPPVSLAAYVSASKLDPDMLTAWVGLMSEGREPGSAAAASTLWLLASADAGGARWCTRVRREAVARGLHPSRIQCRAHAPKDVYVRWYADATLFLDTRLYGAHTTAADALRYGAPVLTLQGDRFANRVGASLLAAVDAPGAAAEGAARALSLRSQLVTHTLKAYHAQAAALVSVRRSLAWRLRARLLERPVAGGGSGGGSCNGGSSAAARSGPGKPPSESRAAAAFNYVRTAAKLERAYRAMWEARAAAMGGAGGIVVDPGALRDL